MLIAVDDPGDPRLAELSGLRDRVLRPRRGQPAEATVCIAEGQLVFERALAAGLACRSVLIAAGEEHRVPAGLAPEVPVYVVPPGTIDLVTGYVVHRGPLAAFDRPPLASVSSVLGGARRVLVGEGIANPTNLGAMVRSAAALGFDALLLDQSSVDPLYRRAARVAMGEGYAFPWTRLPAFPAGLEVLRSAGFRVLALTPAADAVPIDEAAASLSESDHVALVLGTEGPGLSGETLRAADVRVRIPMSGGVDSLNVAAATAVACWALRTGGASRRGGSPGRGEGHAG